MNTFDILLRIEVQIGAKLKEKSIQDVQSWGNNGVAFRENGDVIGLNLDILHLQAIPDEVFMLEELVVLSLVDNKISSISPLICTLSQLQYLSLRFNNITSLPCNIGQLKNLEHFNLDSNRIERVPTEIGGLAKLQYLCLCNNNLHYYPQALFSLGLDVHWKRNGIRGIDLEGNSFVPPPEILDLGQAAIESYLRSIEGDKKPANEVKLLLMGDGGVGKTSLCNQLLDKGFNLHESPTHGININVWDFVHEGNEVLVHLWDFGGQEVMHATHQFFLSKRSLYILVLDGRRSEKPEYWLKYIESFGGDSPILIVLNKADQDIPFDINKKFLKEKYSGIIDVFEISCMTGTGIQKFVNVLKRELLQVDFLNIEWPRKWFEVKNSLENMKDHFISCDGYEQLCHENDIHNEIDQETLLEYLHDLGTVLYFKDFDLFDTFVLDPVWVTGAVYKIINSRLVFDNGGILPTVYLNAILSNDSTAEFVYPRDKYKYIVGIMKKFQICYQIDEENYLIPDLLQIQEKDFIFDYKNSLKFVFQYEFLPRSVFVRMIVKMHKDIFSNDMCWRTGVFLQDPSNKATAVIKTDMEEKKICVYVSGEQRRDYLSVIRKVINDITLCFNKISVKELLQVPDEDYFVEYDELIGYEMDGRDEIYIGKLRKSYSVPLLLSGVEPQSRRKEASFFLAGLDCCTTPMKADVEVPTIMPLHGD